MPPWMRRLFGISDPVPLWVPVYQSVATETVSEPGFGGTTQTQPLNPQDYLSQSSAEWLATTYGATQVKSVPFIGGSGPDSSPAVAYFLVWPDGLSINAGRLAYFYCPAGGDPSAPPGSPGSGKSAPAIVDNPPLAVTLCTQVIAYSRADMQSKVR